MIAQSAIVEPSVARTRRFDRDTFAPGTPVTAAQRLDEALDQLSRPGAKVSYGRDQEIFGEGEPADLVYRVLSGAVRSYRTLSDGRRQVCDFHLAGGYFGFEPGVEHRTTAEALGAVTLLSIRRGALGELASREARISGALWMLSAEGLQRSQDHVFMLGRKNAAERVAGFLLDFAERIGAGDTFELPMSRQDIADYLGLTIETVSRTFSHMEVMGVLKAHNSRRIKVTDRFALQDMSE